MASHLLQADFWFTLGFGLLALWPAVLVLGRLATALSKRTHGLAMQATAGTLLLCLLSAVFQGCFKTILWGILPVLWLVFQTGAVGPKPLRTLPNTIQKQAFKFLGDWATGAGVLGFWTVLAGFFLRLWSADPHNPYLDIFFYGRTANMLGQTGVETSMQELIYFMPGAVSGPTPYHYGELWLAGGLKVLTGISAVAWLEFSIWPLLHMVAALWLSELMARRLTRPLVQRLGLACFLLLAISAGTVLPGTDALVSFTHQHLSNYALTHFYGLKLLWLFIPALGVWAGWQADTPPLYQPSLGWLLLVPLLNVVFPLIVLAAGLMGLLAFRKSSHLPSTELFLATIVTGAWFTGFYLFMGGMKDVSAFTQTAPPQLDVKVLMHNLLVWWLQVQNAIGYWGLIKALPLILIFLPTMSWGQRMACLAWALIVLADLFQLFPYASLVAAFGLFLGGIWLCYILNKRSNYPALLAGLVIVLAPFMVLVRSLPDAHQFYFLPVAAAGLAVVCFGFIQGLSSAQNNVAASLLILLAGLGLMTRAGFVRQNHTLLDIPFLSAWKAKGWSATELNGKGIFFSKEQPKGKAVLATWPLPDLEWVLPGAYLTDASPYVANPNAVLPEKRAFVEILPFRRFTRNINLDYEPSLVGFCAQNRIGLAYVPKGGRIPFVLRDQIVDSLAMPGYNLYRLKTGN